MTLAPASFPSGGGPRRGCLESSGRQLLYSLALPSSVLAPNLAVSKGDNGYGCDIAGALLQAMGAGLGRTLAGLGLSLNNYGMNTDLRDFHLWEGGTVKLGQARPAK